MSSKPTHYEVFSKRTPQAGWVLQMANEDRNACIAAAEEMLATSKAASVMVTKEVFDPETGEFNSLTVFNKGIVVTAKKLKPIAATDTVCATPQELYSPMAREKIARVLEEWLKRYQVTPFELLHRPDLAEKLEATGTELQHAIQKISIPEAQETGQSIHDLIRRWTALVDRSVTRLIQDGRKKLFPDIDVQNFIAQIDGLAPLGSATTDRSYILGGAVAKYMATATKPSGKIEKLLPLILKLCQAPKGREWAVLVLEAPLLEIFASRSSLTDVLGADRDLGGSLCALMRLSAGREAAAVMKFDPSLERVAPPLEGALAGYGELISQGFLQPLAKSVSRRLMQELKGPRRLKPNDPQAEIETLRALALIMSAASEEETQRDYVIEAFTERSRMLVAADFVESLLAQAKDASEEVEKLMWLCENVAGAANKRQAARWLAGAIGGMKFEKDMRQTSKPASQRLSYLAKLQKSVVEVKLPERDGDEINEKLGQLGAMIATDAHILAQIMKSPSSALQKLSMLLNFASGHGAPRGALSEQAKAEALKLLRNPEIRQALGAQPQVLAQLMPLMREAGLAA